MCVYVRVVFTCVSDCGVIVFVVSMCVCVVSCVLVCVWYLCLRVYLSCYGLGSLFLYACVAYLFGVWCAVMV